jgi:NADPH2:quinone reductase
VVEVAVGANLGPDLAPAHPDTVIVTYAAEPADPVLPVRACMTAACCCGSSCCTVPAAALDHAVADISGALADGALTELPSQRHPLSGIVGAHEAAEAGPVGKVLVIPA